MNLDTAETLNELKTILSTYLSIGRAQVDRYESLHNLDNYVIRDIDGDTAEYMGQRLPIRQVQRQLALERDVYIDELITGFWNYFELRLNSIETPASNGIDRALFEICYQRVIPTIDLGNYELKNKIIEKQLCDIGVILSMPSGNPAGIIEEFRQDYDYWLESFSDDRLKNKYQQLKDEEFPHDKLAKSKHELWGSFKYSVNNNRNKIRFPLAGEGDERQQSALNSLLNGYLHLHDFVHGDYVTSLSALRNQFEMKHLFSTYTFITTAAMQMLITTQEEFLDEDREELQELFERSHAVMPSLAHHYSNTGAH